MTVDKHFKRRVRERMAATGESYSTARMRLLSPESKALLDRGIADAKAGKVSPMHGTEPGDK